MQHFYSQLPLACILAARSFVRYLCCYIKGKAHCVVATANKAANKMSATPVSQQHKEFEQKTEEWFGDHSAKKQYITLQNALSCPIATEYFLLHCKKELNEENLMAMLELRAMMKVLDDKPLLYKMTREFCSRFVDSAAPMEINIPRIIYKDLNEDNVAEVVTKIHDAIGMNLVDPFSRFLYCDTLDECIPMCWYNNAQFASKVRAYNTNFSTTFANYNCLLLLQIRTAHEKSKLLNTFIPWKLGKAQPVLPLSAKLLTDLVALVK